MAVLGLASLLNDVSSEMVAPLLPLFLVGTLGAGAAFLGLIEGLADLVASGLKVASGWASDRIGRTRPFVVGGYLLAAGARSLIVLATVPGHLLGARVLDRMGKGVRAAPRDALLAASVPTEQRGVAFGFHRSMDHGGAAIGPAVALLILTFWTEDLRTLFAVAVIPGILAAIVALASREVPHAAQPVIAAAPAPDAWRTLVPVGLATLGTASDSFLMLEAGIGEQTPLQALPVLWIGLHLVRTGIATPGGWLADRFDPRWVVGLGWSLRALVFGILAITTDPAATGLAVIAYGLAGISEGAERKLVATGRSAAGTAFGAYHAVVGVGALPASLGFGLLWEHAGAPTAFRVAAVVVLAGVAALAVLRPR